MKSPPKSKAASAGKARVMTAFTDFNGKFHVVNDADRLKMRTPHDSIPDYVAVAVLELSESAAAARIEAGAKAMNKILPNAEPWRSCLEWQRDEFRVMARQVLTAIGALSTGVKK